MRLDERDRLNVQVSDYVVGRCVEAAIAVITGDGGFEPAAEPAVVDADNREVA